ncbi:MAG: protein kinase domain-containing protein, partial [Kofleriaceae bacterium]
MIQVGQVLDKYELLERVGQGGMAVVYRGLDRSLKRVVAVKVLHKHLSDYQEARDRFEREAQAVAKLRHENILEIFDYSGAEAAEAFGSSYIVTEFIDGQTLKQLITDRPIAFPEIGAMLVLQVCRALAHAHSVGILHRDVKPENIMIRSDGIVKLMDFGISHMVDLERLTVTGQLLGSPAYMAPEHVEGRQLDFRTDVFAAGIVLYQLTVGRLPFEGKNPHEVLKRIAECKFIDPRQANPRIGNRLGRIILRAMSADPDARYPSVGEMVIALEGYLEESGIAADKVPAELARFFHSPASYELALEERLVDHLTRRGQQLLADDDRAGALDVFDRVLTIDADNQKVIAILDGINRRLRIKAGAVGGVLICLVGVGAFMIHRRSQPPNAESPTGIAAGTSPLFERITEVTQIESPPVPVDAAEPPPEVDAPAEPAHVGSPGGGRPAYVEPDAPAAPVVHELKVIVKPSKGSEVRFGDGPWLPVSEDGWIVRPIDRDTVITARNDCCETVEKPARAGQPQVSFDLKLNPGGVIARCDQPGATVKIEDKPATLGARTPVFFASSFLNEKTVTVEFLARDR